MGHVSDTARTRPKRAPISVYTLHSDDGNNYEGYKDVKFHHGM